MIYHIYANQSNIGDWLSAKGIQKLLHPLPITECFCDSPFIAETMNTLAKATEEDLILIGGGGLLMDYFVPFWQAFGAVSDRIPFVIWGIGYCDIKHEHSLPASSIIEEIISKSKLCILRDEMSRAHLSHIQLPEPVHCPSINVIEPIRHPGKDLLHVVNYTTATPRVYKKMCAVTKAFAEVTGTLYRQTNNRITGSERELKNTLSLYKKSQVVVSSALHGCIIGVAMGLKVIAVSGDWKIDAFMNAVGLPEWVLGINETHLLAKRLNNLGAYINPASAIKCIQSKNDDVAQQIKALII